MEKICNVYPERIYRRTNTASPGLDGTGQEAWAWRMETTRVDPTPGPRPTYHKWSTALTASGINPRQRRWSAHTHDIRTSWATEHSWPMNLSDRRALMTPRIVAYLWSALHLQAIVSNNLYPCAQYLEYLWSALHLRRIGKILKKIHVGCYDTIMLPLEH